MSPCFNRRQWLEKFASGFGLLALQDLLHAEELLGSPATGQASPSLAPRAPHFPARANRVIFLFMSGGPSHVDLFDPKPTLKELDGQPLPQLAGDLTGISRGNLLASPFKFNRHGESGLEITELFPALAKHADELCLIRSLRSDNPEHISAIVQLNTGNAVFPRPSLGAWCLYGLGTESRNLPGFVVLRGADGGNESSPAWGASFLPAVYQGTAVGNSRKPIANLTNAECSATQQRKQLDLLQKLNSAHAANRTEDDLLAARISSFELAFRMQTAAPDAFDIEQESTATQKLYGIGTETTDRFGRQCLTARRLVERGVRFIQLYHGLWDHHAELKTTLPTNCQQTDVPIAGLLTDLKSRDLLKDTLVIWGGEFGRTPTSDQNSNVPVNGRDHHPHGFTMWMAGGGVKGGLAYGSTDEFGWNVVENPVQIHDLHATILHLLGLDHKKLTYLYGGRDFRLTDVYGDVVTKILA